MHAYYSVLKLGGWSWGGRAWRWEGGAGEGRRGGGRVELQREGVEVGGWSCGGAVEGCGSTD